MYAMSITSYDVFIALITISVSIYK